MWLNLYRGSPTSTVSSSTISTSTVFQCYVLKTVLVEFLCTINRTSGNWLCSTHQYEFRIVRFFQNPKIRTKRGPPVIPLYAEGLWCKNSPLTLSTNYICYNYNCCCIDVTKTKSFSLCKFLLPNEKNAGSFFVITASEWREALTLCYSKVLF